MDGVFDFLKQLGNPENKIHYGGIYLLLFVVFAEAGLFVGSFCRVIHSFLQKVYYVQQVFWLGILFY